MLPDAAITAFVALGSNLGDRRTYLAIAREELAALPGTRVVATTTIEETAPLAGLEQPAYFNQMVSLETRLPANDLLAECHRIERGAGRERGERWTSRTLDLDLVRYGGLLCDLPALTIPHPGLRDRGFWAREIAELEAHA
ncbi:MAG TPA: 2-amino-4-hydroxy-6-hydroxymethyldihydropteridine diphosphokinase [Gemmatimonadales bacterium]|jgi:2-amino-4-hydroxy-6-hydroxymethyldihydropteridine diphosphokinase